VVQPGTRNRLRIAALKYSMTNAVIFGAGIIAVLNLPALSTNAYFWTRRGRSEPYSSRAYSVADRTASASTVRSVAHKTVMATMENQVLSRAHWQCEYV
jgi:hypothetical protein